MSANSVQQLDMSLDDIIKLKRVQEVSNNVQHAVEKEREDYMDSTENGERGGGSEKASTIINLKTGTRRRTSKFESERQVQSNNRIGQALAGRLGYNGQAPAGRLGYNGQQTNGLVQRPNNQQFNKYQGNRVVGKSPLLLTTQQKLTLNRQTVIRSIRRQQPMNQQGQNQQPMNRQIMQQRKFPQQGLFTRKLFQQGQNTQRQMNQRGPFAQQQAPFIRRNQQLGPFVRRNQHLAPFVRLNQQLAPFNRRNQQLAPFIRQQQQQFGQQNALQRPKRWVNGQQPLVGNLSGQQPLVRNGQQPLVRKLSGQQPLVRNMGLELRRTQQRSMEFARQQLLKMEQRIEQTIEQKIQQKVEQQLGQLKRQLVVDQTPQLVAKKLKNHQTAIQLTGHPAQLTGQQFRSSTPSLNGFVLDMEDEDEDDEEEEDEDLNMTVTLPNQANNLPQMWGKNQGMKRSASVASLSSIGTGTSGPGVRFRKNRGKMTFVTDGTGTSLNDRFAVINPATGGRAVMM